jgi:hypothetical protein
LSKHSGRIVADQFSHLPKYLGVVEDLLLERWILLSN